MQNIEVLKFGSSVLRSATELHIAVDEIYRRWRCNGQIVAVVSAFEGVTDQLIREAGDAAIHSEEAAASYIAQGEQRTAALLVASLTRAGIPSRMIEPREIGLLAEGSAFDSSPVAVDVTAFGKLWETSAVLVLPGFYGVDARGNTALFGRGGSDLSALYLAGALNGSCRLLKDVDGVYDQDPAKGSVAHRYNSLLWQTARVVAGPLIQSKGLEYAQHRALSFQVARPNERASTRVGEQQDELAVPAVIARPLNVALLGCGIVGRGVYELINRYPKRFKVRHVVVRDLDKHAGIPERTTDLSLASDAAIDIVVECFGGIETTLPPILAALSSGKYVVSANKAMLATHWRKIAQYSRGDRRRLFYSSAVGGALPVLETLEHWAGKIPILEVRGLINGTCGVVLDFLAEGKSRVEAIEYAQSLGFAEANPFRDLAGLDSADKLTLIVEKAFGQWLPPHQISTKGIDAIKSNYGEYKLVARARRLEVGVSASVAPENPAPGSFLREAKGAENRVEIELTNGRVIRLRGMGAGRWPTAIAVMGDLHEIARRDEAAREKPEPGFVQSACMAASSLPAGSRK